MADDYLHAPKERVRALQTLARQVPVTLHGVSLGMASTAAVEPERLEKFSRLLNAVEPEGWSEHLALVRGGGREIGHLAAPPRSVATLEGLLMNVRTATRMVGSAPILENVASLVEPPGSTFDEAEWLSQVASEAGTGLLLDLNNLHSNAVNFGFDAHAVLEKLPLERVRQVHLAGGRWIAASNGAQRLLDDHLHDVPEAVYTLLTELAARAPQPLSVILERDGAYPSFALLLAQLERAREAVAVGRNNAANVLGKKLGGKAPRFFPNCSAKAAPRLESYLVRLYVDAEERSRFLADRAACIAAVGVDDAGRAALMNLDAVGLELAAHSFAHKRKRAGGSASAGAGFADARRR